MDDSVKSIQKLLKSAKSLESKGDLVSSKYKYLDAATIAVNRSKSNPTQAMRFNAIAARLVGEAKRLQEEIDLLEISPEFDFPTVGKTIPHKTTQKSNPPITHPNTSSEQVQPKVSSISDIINDFEFPQRDESLTIPLGKCYENSDLKSWEPGKEMNGFIMITGGSGSGKTEGIRSMIAELTEQGYPCTVLDLHGDIEVDIPTISFDFTGKYGINPMAITNISEFEGGPIPKINELMDRFDESIESPFSATQKNMLKNILKITYAKYGIIQSDPKTWKNQQPRFRDLEKNLMDKLEFASGTEGSTINAIQSRLSPILEHPAFNSNNILEFDKLLRYPFRIILKPLRSIGLQFLASDTIMRHLFTYVKSLGHVSTDSDNTKFRMFLVVDEVKILMGYRGKTNDPQNVLNILATEARKFGIGMILASQISKHFGNEVKANSASKLILKPMNSDQAKDNAKDVAVSANALLQLKLPGEGYFKSSSGEKPIHLRLYPYSMRPYVDDLDDL